jgi:hypothetical protein
MSAESSHEHSGAIPDAAIQSFPRPPAAPARVVATISTFSDSRARRFAAAGIAISAAMRSFMIASQHQTPDCMSLNSDRSIHIHFVRRRLPVPA